MIVTPDAEVAARLRRLREHGMDVSAAQRHMSRQPVIEHYLETGYNYRMTESRPRLAWSNSASSRMVARRRELAARYRRCSPRSPASG